MSMCLKEKKDREGEARERYTYKMVERKEYSKQI